MGRLKRKVHLRARDLGVMRGGLPIVQGVSFDLAPGETVEIFGPNGAGKSSLLRAVAGLSVRTGELAWRSAAARDGRAEDGGWSVEREPGLFAWQSHGDVVMPSLSPREHLRFWQRLFHLDGDIAVALAEVGLGALADQPARMLSAGQRRRLSLARLKLSPSPIWLMDEPVAALDAQGVDLVRRSVTDHQSQGGAAIVASHISLKIDVASRIRIERPS